LCPSLLEAITIGQESAALQDFDPAWCGSWGEGGEPSTTNGLQYPMVELFTGGMILPLMFVNAAATCYLLTLTAGIHGGMEKALERTE
jgi:hypothetical protein